MIYELWLYIKDLAIAIYIHTLKLLHQKNMISDLPCLKENNEACEGCLLDKKHRLPFSTSKAWRAKET